MNYLLLAVGLAFCQAQKNVCLRHTWLDVIIYIGFVSVFAVVAKHKHAWPSLGGLASSSVLLVWIQQNTTHTVGLLLVVPYVVLCFGYVFRCLDYNPYSELCETIESRKETLRQNDVFTATCFGMYFNGVQLFVFGLPVVLMLAPYVQLLVDTVRWFV